MNADAVIQASWMCGAVLVIGILYVLVTRLRTARIQRKLIAENGCKPAPAYPHKDPFGFDVIKEATEAFRSRTFLSSQCLQYALHGTTFSSRYITQTIIKTIDPENIKAVLTTNFGDYGVGWRRKDAFEPLLGQSLFQLDGHAWAASRSLLQPSFGHAQVKNLGMVETHVRQLLEKVSEKTKHTPQVDLAPLFVRLAADLTTDFIHGKSVDSLKDESAEVDREFLQAIDEAGKGCEKRWQLGLLSKFFPQRQFYRNVKKVHAHMDKHIDDVFADESEKKRELQYDFLATLSRATRDRKVLRDEMCMIFIAGTDATACLLTSMFFLIGKYPEVWSKLREEIKPLEGRPPSIKELKGLKYLQSCLNECKSCPSLSSPD